MPAVPASPTPELPSAAPTPSPAKSIAAPGGAVLAAPVTHYENFPVASWLCPPRFRPAIAAVYWFARSADDMADEGDAPAAQRLGDLAAFRADLHAAAGGQVCSQRWPQVFGPLAAVVNQWQIPLPLLDDLLQAFEQDVIKTRDGTGYADRAHLLDYCRRSANPIGRILLHLYGVRDATSLAQSDAICSALQLINFWQDLSVDLPRGRYYLPQDRCTAMGLDFAKPTPSANATALVAEQVQWARDLMHTGAPLVHAVPGRAGWELRLVVQGGLAILDRIAAMNYATLHKRPQLTKPDLARMLWRSLWMAPRPSTGLGQKD